MDTSPLSVGNKELITSEDEMLAAFLRERNLEKTNEHDKQRPVKVADGIYVRYVKRSLDLVLAIPAFIVTLPFNIVFGICTYFDVGKPIIYRQTRIGKDGKPF